MIARLPPPGVSTALNRARLGGGTMDNPRPEKVAVVDEVRERLAVGRRRRAHRVPGPDRRRAGRAPPRADRRRRRLQDLQEHPRAAGRRRGPTGGPSPTCSPARRPSPSCTGDVSAVAKALRDFARDNPSLVMKGGMVGRGLLTAADINALADLPSRGRPAGPVGRGPGRTASAAGRPDAGAAPEPGLRPGRHWPTSAGGGRGRRRGGPASSPKRRARPRRLARPR